MSLFAIGDLHLSFAREKPMDIFGDNWKDHAKKVEKYWRESITLEDTVLIPGDISWALELEDAKPDLDFLNELPGKKIFISGNHDYWWCSTSKVQSRYPEMKFLRNEHTFYEDYAICGSRGWVCPNDSHFTEHDRKIYNREQIRLKLSLESALRRGANKIILMMHYPPTNDKKEVSGFQEVFENYPIETVVYGHLHGSASFGAGLQGKVNGIEYHLVSSDYLDFHPKKIR